MKTTLALAIALAVQTVSAATPSSSASAPSSSLTSKNQPKVTAPIGDKMAQDLVEKFAIFRWEGNNTFAKESFAFELNEPTRLQVIDFKHHGDMFDVYDHGKMLGSSSKVVYDENVETYAATPQEALLDDHFSKGAFSLEKGPHNITIMAHGPYQVGSAALRLLERTNLVLAKDHGEEEEEEEGDKEEEDDHNSDWRRMHLGKKKHGDQGKHFEHRQSKKEWAEKNHQGRPDFHGNHMGPKTVTHWKVVRETAIPYATRLAFEHDEHY